MSMCSLTDFIEMSLGRCGGWVSTATVTGQGASLVDPSVRGGDFSWPKTGTSRGHQRGHQLAITGDFFMATDIGRARRGPRGGSTMAVWGAPYGDVPGSSRHRISPFALTSHFHVLYGR
jgi:hypothetical protein